MILFEDGELQAVLRPGQPGRPLLITFSPLRHPVDGETFWGWRVAERLGMPGLGIVAKRPNWYPAASMAPLIGAVRPALAGYPSAIAYGYSMGGYGALKYGAALGAGTALAVAPQATIDPAAFTGLRIAFSDSFDPSLHAGMAVRPEDAPARPLVIADPHEREDAAQVALLRALPGLAFIPVPMTGHGAIHLFADSRFAAALLEASADGELDLARRLVAERRRRHWARVAGLSRIAARRRRARLAQRLIERRGRGIPPNELSHLHAGIAYQLLRQGQPAEAAWFLTRLRETDPAHHAIPSLVREERLAAGDRDGALSAAREAAAGPRAVFHDRLMLARLLLDAGLAGEAAPLIQALLAVRPDEAGLRLMLDEARAVQG